MTHFPFLGRTQKGCLQALDFWSFSSGFRNHSSMWALGASQGGSVGKESACSAETQETWARSLGGDDLLEEEMVTLSRVLAWRIPWTEGPGGLSLKVCKELDTSEATEQVGTQGLWRQRNPAVK